VELYREETEIRTSATYSNITPSPNSDLAMDRTQGSMVLGRQLCTCPW
jgi:hypothetical protein